jgi:hypothetical protein
VIHIFTKHLNSINHPVNLQGGVTESLHLILFTPASQTVKLDSHLQLFNLQPSTSTMYTWTFWTQLSTPRHTKKLLEFTKKATKKKKCHPCDIMGSYKHQNKNREYEILILNLLSFFSFIFTLKNAVNYENEKLFCDVSSARNFGTVTIWAMHLGGMGLSTLALQSAHLTQHSKVSLGLSPVIHNHWFRDS